MKKLIVLISCLLIATTAYATDWQTALTADYSARNQGKSVITDSSVIVKVWDPKSTNANQGLGVSSSSAIVLYTDILAGTGITINPTDSSYDTVGEIVDYINQTGSTSSSITWKACVVDSYRSMASQPILDANIATIGISRTNTDAVVYSESSNRFTCGVEANDGVTPRLKSIVYPIPFQDATDGYITLDVYDGNTRVWSKTTSLVAYNTATDPSNSCNAVTLDGDKGLSATKGNNLCVVATPTANVGTSTAEKALLAVSIIYDQYKD